MRTVGALRPRSGRMPGAFVLLVAASLLAAGGPRTAMANVVVHAAGLTACDRTAPVRASCAASDPTFHFGSTVSAGTAYANLATGELTASAGTSGGILGVGTGQAEMTDTINLVLPAGYSSPLVPVTVALNFASVLLVDDACASDRIILGYSTDGNKPRTGGGACVEPDGHGGFQRSGTSLDVSLTEDFSAGSLNGIVLDALLQTFAGDNLGNGYANVDPNLTITLPPGVTFTSDSGALLTQMPEPVSLALLGVALAGIGLVRRRKV